MLKVAGTILAWCIFVNGDLCFFIRVICRSLLSSCVVFFDLSCFVVAFGVAQLGLRRTARSQRVFRVTCTMAVGAATMFGDSAMVK